jgi:hypothetical protein
VFVAKRSFKKPFDDDYVVTLIRNRLTVRNCFFSCIIYFMGSNSTNQLISSELEIFEKNETILIGRVIVICILISKSQPLLFFP